jgi:hypothetical protein
MLAFTELLCNFLIFTIELDSMANAVLSVVVYVFVIRKLLILKPWQAVIIPIGVKASAGLILMVFNNKKQYFSRVNEY